MHVILMDLDTVGSETFSRIRIWKGNYHSGSGSGRLQIRNEFEVKQL
jgi:hypothetical protein